MDLTTTYLGMTLRSPLVPSASPLSEETDNLKRMEDAGASAVVLHSLFEEQLRQERLELHHHLTHGTESYAESLTYFPEPTEFRVGPEEYLDHVRKAKAALNIPVIASLNGSSVGGWTEYARAIEQAGADALELNIYSIPTDFNQTGAEVEQLNLEILRRVKAVVSLPVAVKVSAFYSNFANMARQFDEAGANGLVLFNRFYQPDIDLEDLEIRPNLLLSTPQALRLPLRWIAILYGHVGTDLAATSGIHSAQDVVKMLLVGAGVTQLCSVLLRRGIDHIRHIEADLAHWLEEHEYESVRQMRGSMSQKHCADPAAFERAQYMKTLHSYRPADGKRT
jgi:dihydroorotate dehydrogenase (fumarate)